MRPAPYMTSATTPGNMRARTSSSYISNYGSVFSEVTPTGSIDIGGGSNNTIPAGVELNTGEDNKYRLVAYRITTRNAGAYDAHTPYSWQIQCCETILGTKYDIVDTRKNIYWPQPLRNVKQTFYISDYKLKPGYTKFRIYVTAKSNGGDSFVNIKQLLFYFETREDGEINNVHFYCPDLQYLAPPGFKTYIYIGN